MNFTVSRRQSQLYEQKGFNLSHWESLIEEGNRLRREIKMVADEYDVEWDESKDEGDEKVKEALRKARKKNGKKEGKKEEDEDEEDEDD
jgi:calcium uniporter protein, mitochondrial